MKNNKNLANLLSNNAIPFYIKSNLKPLFQEEAHFAADEVSALAEACLAYFNGLVMMAYLREGKQTEKLNQMLLDFFTGTKRHAGEVYRTITTKILLFKPDHPLADKLLDKQSMNYRKEINDLATLRNEIMHGLFVLPPDKNHENTERIATLLENFFADGFAQMVIDNEVPQMNGLDMRPYFTVEENNITLNDGLSKVFYTAETDEVLKDTGDFYRLYQKSISEQTIDYIDKQISIALSTPLKKDPQTDSILNQIHRFLDQEKGNVWVHGYLEDREAISTALIKDLTDKNTLVIPYTLENNGLKYTALYALKQLFLKTGLSVKKDYKESPEKYIEKLKSDSAVTSVVFIINSINKRQFAENHVLTLMNDFYSKDVRVVGLSDYYPSLSPFFNASIEIVSERTQDLTPAIINQLLNDYLYDTGPDQAVTTQDKQDYEELKKAVDLLWKQLNEQEYVNLRNLAGSNNTFSFLMLEEAADIIAPYVERDTLLFEPTEWDPLTDLPMKETESSLIYTILGRHDIRMEYEQPILFLSKNHEKWQATKKRLLEKYFKIQEKIDNPLLYLEELEKELQHKND